MGRRNSPSARFHGSSGSLRESDRLAGEVSDFGPDESGEMGPAAEFSAEIVGQGPDIGARRASDFEVEMGRQV